MSDKTSKTQPAMVCLGLFIALVLTTVISFPVVLGNLLPRSFVARNVCAQLIDWGFAIGLVILVIFGEKKSLRSLGFSRPTLPTFFAALGLTGFFMTGVVAWKIAVSPWFPDVPLPSGPTAIGTAPPYFYHWYAPFALLTASIAEEVVYRGYAMTRLLDHFKSPIPALILPQLAFALMHLKDGIENTLMIFVLGTLFTWFFYETRNLTLLILAHFMIDFLAIAGSQISN